jgi:hypothetical protein
MSMVLEYDKLNQLPINVVLEVPGDSSPFVARIRESIVKVLP